MLNLIFYSFALFLSSSGQQANLGFELGEGSMRTLSTSSNPRPSSWPNPLQRFIGFLWGPSTPVHWILYGSGLNLYRSHCPWSNIPLFSVKHSHANIELTSLSLNVIFPLYTMTYFWAPQGFVARRVSALLVLALSSTESKFVFPPILVSLFCFLAFSNQRTAINCKLFFWHKPSSARYGQWHKDKKEPQSKNVPRIIAFVVRFQKFHLFTWPFTFACPSVRPSAITSYSFLFLSWLPCPPPPTPQSTGPPSQSTGPSMNRIISQTFQVKFDSLFQNWMFFRDNYFLLKSLHLGSSYVSTWHFLFRLFLF